MMKANSFQPIGLNLPLSRGVNYLLGENKKDPKATKGTMILDFNKDGRFDRADLDSKIKELDRIKLFSSTSGKPNEKLEKTENEILLIQSVLRGEDLFVPNGKSNNKTTVSLFDFNNDKKFDLADLKFKEDEYKKTGNKKAFYEAEMLNAMLLPKRTPPIKFPPEGLDSIDNPVKLPPKGIKDLPQPIKFPIDRPVKFSG
jgi:hypothetical protein